MRRLLERVFGRKRITHSSGRLDTVPEPPEFPTRPRSLPVPVADLHPQFRYGALLSPPYGEPTVLFPFLRYLRDAIPDVSAGVWAWVRLCSTGQYVEYAGGNETEQREAAELVAALDRRIYEFDHARQQGMDALVQGFFLSVFTYGAFAGEVVLTEDRQHIDRFYVIDPATVRFRRYPSSRRVVPYQEVRDEVIPLGGPSFFYYALDPDGDNPYGRSMLLALPFVVRLQQQLLEDMGKAQHNAGYPQLHIKFHPPQREPGEALTAYQARVERDYDNIRDGLRRRKPDSNFLTYDNVDIEYVGPSGRTVRWLESYQAISEQVVSALHLAPFLLGRNWGTTESWGRAQYRLVTNNARSVQRGAKRLCEWLRNLEIALAGLPVQVRHHFEPHDSLDQIEAAQAEATRVQTAFALFDRGLLDRETLRRRLNL